MEYWGKKIKMTEHWKRLIMFFLAGTLMLTITPNCVYVYPTPGPGSAPTTPEVREEHQRILQKYYGIEKHNMQAGTKETSGRIGSRPVDGRVTKDETPGYEEESSFSEFLESLGQLPLPVILIIIAFLVILFYLAFRGVPGAFRKSLKPSGQTGRVDKGTPEADEEGRTGIQDKGYAAALELAKNKEYGRALVVLHKTSVKKLQEQRLIPSGFHFTNNEIKQLIQNSLSAASFLNSFAQLATAAERAAFRKENPDEATYIRLRTIYENSFLKMNRIR
jgi:hypothetical protein